MKTFDEIYEELNKINNNNELKSEYSKLLKKNKRTKRITILACLIVNFIIIKWLYQSGFLIKYTCFIGFFLVFFMVINVFTIIIVNLIFGGGTSKYSFKFKKMIISKLINNFYDNVEYYPEKPMPEYIYKKLQYEHYDSYYSEDYFEGYIHNKYSIQMAEILTQEEEEYEDSDGEEQIREITIFHGLFAKIVMEKSIKSEIKIIQDGTGRSNKKLEMDSSEFEKYFDVIASDPIIGMQVLTADVMEELIEFENKTKMKFDIYIKGNELYLRFHSGEMFEVGVQKNGELDKEVIKKYFYMLNFTYNLSNKLINVINDVPI